MRNPIVRIIVVLGGVSFLAGLALAGVRALTAPIIERALLQETIKPSLERFFKPLNVDNDYLAERKVIDLGKDERGRAKRLTVFIGKKNKLAVAAAVQTEAAGYGGKIQVLAAVDLSRKTLLGIKTLSQSETIGLGARIANDQEPFIRQFRGLPYTAGIRLKSLGGDVDAISGATLSSLAVTHAVQTAVDLLAQTDTRP